MCLPFALFAQTSDPRFKHLSVEQGLSQVTVFCILQDRQGFLWFGTQDGLNRYDGYTFKVYKHIPGDSTSLSHNTIRALAEVQEGLRLISEFAENLPPVVLGDEKRLRQILLNLLNNAIKFTAQGQVAFSRNAEA